MDSLLLSDLMILNSYVDMMQQYRRTLCITFNYQWNSFVIRNAIRIFFIGY